MTPPLAKPNTWSGGNEPLEVLAGLGGHLRALQRSTGLAPVPEDPTHLVYAQRHRSRVRSACKWLYQLGYSDEILRWEDPYAEVFSLVVRRFQEDAGLVVDGWMGPQTWGALEALITFEGSGGIEKLLPEVEVELDDLERAVQRAVLLRLNVLEHATLLPYHDIPDEDLLAVLEEGLAAFVAFQWALGVESVPDGPRAIPWLFDHEHQLRAMADYMTAPRGGRALPRARRLRRPILAVARVELWLQDHDVGALDRTSSYGLTWAALTEERQRRGLPEESRRSRMLDPALLEAWREDLGHRGEEEVLDEPEAQHNLHRALAELGKRRLARTWSRLTESRFALWDGVKRAARWLGRLARRSFSRVLRALRQAANGLERLVRWLYRSASRALSAIFDAAQAFVRVFSGPIESGAGASRLSCDFDLSTVVWEGPRAVDHARFVRTTLQGFIVALELLGIVVQIIMGAVTGGWTWLLVIRKLALVLPELEQRGAALEAAQVM